MVSHRKKMPIDFSRVRLMVMDFDGVHTDGRVFTDENGVESVVCSRRDGMGLELLRRETDVTFFVISKENNPVVGARCRKLKIQCAQGVDNGEEKSKIFHRLITESGCSVEETLYMGDDVVDIPPMKIAGISVAVADAHFSVKEIASYVTLATGGNGAIREICDMIIEAKSGLTKQS
jgi:YrbI family 3-deoxy-D-manno-octulosonate 8-phosphate phosphatase